MVRTDPRVQREIGERHGWQRLSDERDATYARSTLLGRACKPRSGKSLRVCFHETKALTDKLQHHQGGYFSAKLKITIDGVLHRQHCFLHRIVWMARYRQPILAGEEIDHGPAGKPCNHWTNLEKVTPAENSRRREERAGSEVPF